MRNPLPVPSTLFLLALAACSSGKGGSSSGPGTDPNATGADGGPGSGGTLPEGTLLYLRSESRDQQSLVARDLASGEERVVTDLRADGGDGWDIRGYAVSPDRTRIAFATLYGATAEDNATKLATRRIWSSAPDGSDMRRLTPPFPNTSGGRSRFSLEVGNPAFDATGESVVFDYGTYWYENTELQGGSAPWRIATSGDALPEAFPTASGCTIVRPARNPATGEMLLHHSVCTNKADEGLFLYPAGGGTAPTKLVGYSYDAGGVAPANETPSWVADGSGFVFTGRVTVPVDQTTEVRTGLLAYDATTNEISVVVLAEGDTAVINAAVAPDASSVVYCLRTGDSSYDLHLIDLSVSPATDTPITNDGKSCSPGF